MGDNGWTPSFASSTTNILFLKRSLNVITLVLYCEVSGDQRWSLSPHVCAEDLPSSFRLIILNHLGLKQTCCALNYNSSWVIRYNVVIMSCTNSDSFTAWKKKYCNIRQVHVGFCLIIWQNVNQNICNHFSVILVCLIILRFPQYIELRYWK